LERGVRDYYARFGEREWARLENPSDGQVEFAITRAVLAQHLQPGARVLDLGGGPGRYTIWLAEQGHRVTLGDLSIDLLNLARTHVREASVEDKVEAILELDARDLSVFPDGCFDAVVCLGPFYHLPDRADRVRAASELSRVLRPGGVAFVGLMPRLALLRRTMALVDERRHLLQASFVEPLLADGAFFNDVPGRFTHGYGARPEEVGPFFDQMGFDTLALLSTESITVGLQDALPDLLADESLATAVLSLAIKYAGEPSTLGFAYHLLYVGRRRADAKGV
jgi:ubiquinone/menaquinone biosynthesis C-methylase UbiE